MVAINFWRDILSGDMMIWIYLESKDYCLKITKALASFNYSLLMQGH